MRAAFSKAIVDAAKADPKILLLTGDHGYALFDDFRKALPDQFINAGIAEQNMVGVAAGLAKAGFKPIVYGLAAFVPVRVLEQIKIDICYENLPVILLGDGAGLVYSHLGTSHQSTEDIACTRAIPSLTVLSPGDRFEMAAVMKLAFDLQAPVYIRMGKSDRRDIHKEPFQLSIGQMLKVREGSGKTAILATGSMVSTALDLVDSDGFDAEVWSVPSIKPINTIQLNEIAQRVLSIISIEEHSVIGGLGACIAEEISGNNALPICRIGIEDRFSNACGTWEYLLEEHHIDIASISKKIHKFLKKNEKI